MICDRCGASPAARNDEWCSACILDVEALMAELEDPQEPEFKIPRNYYTREDLEHWVMSFELEYGMDSETLLSLHRMNMAPIDLPAFEQHVWLSYYRELMEEGGD